jgi:hypothetical protein
MFARRNILRELGKVNHEGHRGFAYCLNTKVTKKLQRSVIKLYMLCVFCGENLN